MVSDRLRGVDEQVVSQEAQIGSWNSEQWLLYHHDCFASHFSLHYMLAQNSCPDCLGTQGTYLESESATEYQTDGIIEERAENSILSCGEKEVRVVTLLLRTIHCDCRAVMVSLIGAVAFDLQANQERELLL